MRLSFSEPQKRRGRPPTGVTPQVGVRFAPQILTALDTWREAQPDRKDADWVSVQVEPIRAIDPVTLKDIKAEPKLAKMELIRQSRLSVAPVRDDEWWTVLEMAE